MADDTRIAMLHTGAVVIAPLMELVRRELPGSTTINYLDDRIVADLRDPDASASVPDRVTGLARAAVAAGARAILLTCSSISELAAQTSEEAGVPVLRIDEAMADEAAAFHRVAVLATLPTTCEPTTRLIRERAALAGRDPSIRSEVIDGAFAAVSAGDRAEHDRLVVAAIEAAATGCDVIVLAQASMAGAAAATEVAVPVLTSLEPGVRRLRELVESLPARR
ncbi:aspartate/glutamate racemase family protein [Georgenia halophila]|uniref:Aspartate/glutamate racemase family protein n=1 Tax=Georgenia halophila TaxID=620889 RepID=A0ABP8LSA6_9MICO